MEKERKSVHVHPAKITLTMILALILAVSGGLLAGCAGCSQQPPEVPEEIPIPSTKVLWDDLENGVQSWQVQDDAGNIVSDDTTQEFAMRVTGTMNIGADSVPQVKTAEYTAGALCIMDDEDEESTLSATAAVKFIPFAVHMPLLTSVSAATIDIPEGVDPEAWKGYVEYCKLMAEYGFEPAAWNDSLIAPGGVRSSEQPAQPSPHYRPDGAESYSVMNEFGLDPDLYCENTAYGTSSGVKAMTALQNSGAHLGVMLGDAKYTAFVSYKDPDSGITYWTQVFYNGELPADQSRVYDVAPATPEEAVEAPTEQELAEVNTILGTPVEIGDPDEPLFGFQPDDKIDISQLVDEVELAINLPVTVIDDGVTYAPVIDDQGNLGQIDIIDMTDEALDNEEPVPAEIGKVPVGVDQAWLDEQIEAINALSADGDFGAALDKIAALVVKLAADRAEVDESFANALTRLSEAVTTVSDAQAAAEAERQQQADNGAGWNGGGNNNGGGGLGAAPNDPPSVTPPPAVQMVTVPSVVGMSRDAAIATITGAGFTVGSIFDPTGSGNVVRNQNPGSGTQAPLGSAIGFELQQ